MKTKPDIALGSEIFSKELTPQPRGSVAYGYVEPMSAPFLRTPYNYDVRAAGRASALHCPEPTRTKQSFVEECDINTIVRRFKLTGELPSNVRLPQYGDFTQAYDYKSAMDAIRAANESFNAMPADVRARFDNDPAQFVDFCNDEKNHAEALKLGLVMPKAASLAQSAPAVPSTPQNAPTGSQGPSPALNNVAPTGGNSA